MLRKMIGLVCIVALVMVGGCCKECEQQLATCQAEKENLQALFDATQETLNQCATERDEYAQKLGMTQKELEEARSRQATQPKADLFPGEDARWDAQKGTITVTLESGVLFDSGKASLKRQAKSRLDHIAGTIKDKYSGKEVSVVGHTDTDPIRKSSWKDNWELSTERALAVTRYLIDQGISAKQLIAAGRGEHHPISDKKQVNRRVEIVVHMYGGK